MPYDFMKTRVLSRVREHEGAESDEHWLVPYEYVVAHFGKQFTGYPPVVDDADLDRVLGDTVPLRFVDAEALEIVYSVPTMADNESRTRAHAARDLLAQFDGLEECAPSCVPTDIAARAKNRPELAMYLFSYQLKTYEEIAAQFGVKIDTIRQYRSRVHENLTKS